MNFNIRSYKDIYLPRKPIEYVVEGLISTSSLNIFFGAPGSKKTYSLLNMAVAVSNGSDWLNFKTKKFPVLFIDEESGGDHIVPRLEQVVRGTSLYDVKENIDLNYLSLSGIKLDKQKDIDGIEQDIKEKNIKLIILDALSEVVSGDENSKKDIQPVMSNLKRIAENTHSAVILIHHTTKDGIEYRGSSAIGASADLIVRVTSKQTSPFITFEPTKNREGNVLPWNAKAIWEENSPIVFHLNPTIEVPKKVLNRKDFILKILKENGELSIKDMVDRKGDFTEATIKQTVSDLKRDDKIYRTNGKAGDSNAIYDIVE